MEYKAITKEAIMPTRSSGMGKIMIEILNIHLLTNTILLRDWVIVEGENGEILYKEMLRSDYPKIYPDNAFSMIFSSTGILLDSPQENYTRLKNISSQAIVIMNNFDPPYSLPQNSFVQYNEPIIVYNQPNNEQN